MSANTVPNSYEVCDANLGEREIKDKNVIFPMLQEYKRKNGSLIFCEGFKKSGV